jgi:hypothetical protein
MAYSTATTSFNPDLNEIFEEAFERCGLELRTGYDFRTARRSLNFLIGDWANRGINLWTIEQGYINLEQGVTTYNLPDDTVDLIEHVIRTDSGQGPNQTDLNITRISVSTYSTIPNKLAQGRPIQVWINRQSGQKVGSDLETAAKHPQINVWPAPDQGTTTEPYYVFYYWRLKRVYDAGTGTNIIDIPFRFQNCLVAGLAYMLAVKKPEVAPERVAGLKAMYDEAWEWASTEDREKAADRLVPREMFF